MNDIHFKILLKIFLFFLYFTLFKSQNISLITPICGQVYIKYSIYENFIAYLDNEKNIDKRDIYLRPSYLKTKRIGILKGYSINKEDFENVTTFVSISDLINSLKNHTVDAIISMKRTYEYICLHNYDLTEISEKSGLLKLGFALWNDTYLTLKFNEFLRNINIESIYNKWFGIYYVDQIDKNINESNEIISTILYLQYPPSIYKDEKGELIGSYVDFIYSFAKTFGYKVNFKEANSYKYFNSIYYRWNKKW